jgi:hypothetical protein
MYTYAEQAADTAGGIAPLCAQLAHLAVDLSAGNWRAQYTCRSPLPTAAAANKQQTSLPRTTTHAYKTFLQSQNNIISVGKF